MNKSTKVSGYLLVILLLLSSNAVSQRKKGEPSKKYKSKQQDSRPRGRTIEDLKRELGADWEKIILEMIEAEQPDEIETLKQEKRKNPAQYENRLAKLWNDIRRLEKYRNEDPARYDEFKKQLMLERDCRKLAQKFRKSDDENIKSKLKTDLKSRLNELFSLREAEREEKLRELEQEIARLKEMLAFREKNRHKIIEKRLREMLDEDELLQW